MNAPLDHNSKIIDPTEYSKNSWYRGSSGLKKAGVNIHITPEMKEEIVRCRNDIEYFCSKYIYITDVDKGVVKFNARPYQRKFWKLINKNRFIISKQGRQAGKTAAIVGFLIHYAIFHKKRTVGIAAQNVSQAKEIIHRFKLAYENIPVWLQPGVVEWQKGSVALGNGTRIFASSSNGDALRGKSLSVLILDEFAHIRNDQEFMTATWPVVSSGKETKIIIISTPNGTSNAFHQIWKESEENKNGFVNFPVEWNEVPGRDEKWREAMIKQYGKRKFAQEYAAAFLGSSNTLVDAHKLEELEKNVIESIDKDNEHNVTIYKNPIPGRSYVMCVDVGRGYGNDYSTFSIFDTTEKPFEQVAVFSDNMISTKVLPYLIKKYAQKYNEAFVVVERNDAGGEVANILYYDIEYPELYSERDGSIFKPGLWTSKTVKRTGCSNLRDLIENDALIINHPETLKEFKSFEGDAAGIYNAKKGYHDDLVQNCWQLGYVLDTRKMEFFNENTPKVSAIAHKSAIEKLIDELPPIGILNGKSLSTKQTERLRSSTFTGKSAYDIQTD